MIVVNLLFSVLLSDFVLVMIVMLMRVVIRLYLMVVVLDLFFIRWVRSLVIWVF